MEIAGPPEISGPLKKKLVLSGNSLLWARNNWEENNRQAEFYLSSNEWEYKELREQRDFPLVFQQGTGIAANLSVALMTTDTELSRFFTRRVALTYSAPVIRRVRIGLEKRKRYPRDK